jgi:TonB family protein
MKLNKHEQPRPNVAGLTSRVQQAEMKLILADMWPPLKPLPVFKYGTDEYRAEIHFDRTRGEWVCRKTSLPSNKVQELCGGLTEMTMALPHGQANVFTEAVAAEPQEQELGNKTNRRLQTILEWRDNYGNGALYSELQDYLSESQQDEIYDSIRMTLTARQLQFNPKNVEFVFDALWKAGGRLATLIDIAQRNKAEQEADAQAQAETAALEAESQVPAETIHPTRDRRFDVRSTPASLAYVMFGDTNGGIVLNISETGMSVAVADVLVVGDYLPRIRIQLPSSRQSIEISAQIVWLAESKKGAGIRFVDLTAEAHNQISNWIESEKPAPEFEQLPKHLPRDKQPLEISSRKSRRIFSNPSIRDEEAAARYEEMFPSESSYAKHTTSVDEINPQQGPLPIPVGSHAGAGDSVIGSAAEISTGDFPQNLEASFPSERARHFVPEPIKTSIPELSESLTPEPIEGLILTTLENFPTEPIGSVSPDQIDTSSPELIARTGPRASEIVAREILDASALSLVEDLQEKVHQHTPVAGFGPQVPIDKVESPADRIEDPPSHFRVLEVSGFQAAACVFLFAVIGFTVGLTLGRGPLGGRLRDTQKSILAVDATSPALPNRPGKTTSPTSTPPPADTFDTPAMNPPAAETEALRSESASAQPSLKGRPADSATRARPTGPSSEVTSRSHIDSDDSSGANKLDDAPPSEEKSKESTRDSESFAKVPSTASNSSPTIESKPSANPEVSPERNGSTGLIARNAPPPASPEPAHSPKAVGPIGGAPRHPAPRRVTPAMGAAPHRSPPSVILVTAPARGGKSFRVSFPQEPIAASSSFAIASQLSVLISPEPGPAVARQPARLQAGQLVSYVWPRYPRLGDRYRSTETVKVRATIGQLGQVLDIKLLNGSSSLLPAAMGAIRRWRYKPTLLNERPVQAQQDVTIEFTPPRYLSHVRAQRKSHN